MSTVRLSFFIKSLNLTGPHTRRTKEADILIHLLKQHIRSFCLGLIERRSPVFSSQVVRPALSVLAPIWNPLRAVSNSLLFWSPSFSPWLRPPPLKSWGHLRSLSAPITGRPGPESTWWRRRWWNGRVACVGWRSMIWRWRWEILRRSISWIFGVNALGMRRWIRSRLESEVFLVVSRSRSLLI